MERLDVKTTATACLVYLGIAILIHVPLVAEYFFIPPGREALIASLALGSTTLMWQLTTYLFAVALLNLLPLGLMLGSYSTLRNKLRRVGLSPTTYFAGVSLSFWIAVLSFNAIVFPRSAFAVLMPLEPGGTPLISGIIATGLFTALCAAPLLWKLVCSLRAWLQKPAFRLSVGVIFAAGMVQPLHSLTTGQSSARTQPDVIIIGVDSLSPMHMEHHPQRLPVLEQMLRGSTVFTNTITPLGRTFPAWTSILTARYPINHGARFNLTSFDQVSHQHTLAHILRDRGYTTIYAQDERKFNNLDESFGFVTTVGPKPGAAEFLLTRVSDHPVANLATLVPGSNFLFPFIKNNRADDIHYSPDEFVEAVLDQLPSDNSAPLFLATHFCLAHYPYTWRTRGRADRESGAPTSADEQHIAALGHLEHQIDKLIAGLRKAGRMENTLVVLLSDHGEALGYTDGLWPSLSATAEEFPLNSAIKPFNPTSQMSGHGGNVLDRTQYLSVLAFKGYGSIAAHFPAARHTRIASLVDVMPTILGALGVAVPDQLDGIDLLNSPEGSGPEMRTVSAETGISFAAMASLANLNEDELFEQAQEYYTVEPSSARLIVKPQFYSDLVAEKSIAIHTDAWMLAFLRQSLNPIYKRVTLLIDKTTGEWTLGEDSELIERAPLSVLVGQARIKYGDELADFETSWAMRFTKHGTIPAVALR